RPPATPVDAQTDWAPGLERIFPMDGGLVEGRYPLEAAEGAMPDYVRGSYYVNGPSRFGRAGQRQRHWLDGDGMVVALHIDGPSVELVNRYVRGTKLVEEEAAGRFLYRTFGTAFDGDQLMRGIGIESPLNVSVWPFAGRLLAFGEQGLPYSLDADSLETIGLDNFGGRLNPIAPFSAHPCFPQEGGMMNFGVSFSARHPCIHLYRFDDDGALVKRSRLHLEQPSSIHDFGISAQHVAVYVSPHVLDIGQIMRGGRSIMESLAWRPELGSTLLIADRESGEMRGSIPIGSGYCLHLINAFDDDDSNALVVDVLELDRPVYDEYEVMPDLFLDAPLGRAVRFVVDRGTWTVREKRALGYDRTPDFPQTDPRLDQRSYDHMWMLGMAHAGKPGRKFFDQAAHLSWSGVEDVWTAPEGCYLGGEPVMIPDPSSAPETRGVVLCQLYDTRDASAPCQVSFVVFDAFDLASGPIARLPLRHPIAPGFHACFEPRN
ncbi:MAG: carotenoid oxygenase family protein, partial [Acidobacteriota bacterium]